MNIEIQENQVDAPIKDARSSCEDTTLEQRRQEPLLTAVTP